MAINKKNHINIKCSLFISNGYFSSDHKNEIQFFKNHLPCPWILKMIHWNKWFNPPGIIFLCDGGTYNAHSSVKKKNRFNLRITELIHNAVKAYRPQGWQINAHTLQDGEGEWPGEIWVFANRWVQTDRQKPLWRSFPEKKIEQ